MFACDPAAALAAADHVTSRHKKTGHPPLSRTMTLCLHEHDRCRSALAAATATFPLNDVDFASSGTWPLLAANLVFRIPTPARLATVAQNARLMTNWWSQSGSNRRPDACKATALPAELWPHSGEASVAGGHIVPLGFRAMGRGSRSALPNGSGGWRANRSKVQNGGPGTTRTSDLTLIRGAL